MTEVPSAAADAGVAVDDVALEVPVGEKHVELVVREITRETDEACSVAFDVPEEARDKFGYKPGQFLTLQLPGPDGPVGRCYSLCSSPHVDDVPRIAVKRVKDGVGSNWINDTLEVGAKVAALPPAGTFTPKTLDEDLLLFAGGSGITPVLSILKSALAEGTGRVVLVYANQHERSVIFAAQLRELATQYPDRFHVLHWLESVQGLPTHAQLTALAAPYTSYTAFVCGPSPFMESVTHVLRELHVPPSRIHIERFQSLAQNPFEDVVVAAPTEGGATAVLEVNLDGEDHTFDWPVESKLLDFLLSKGLDAPFSCRQGACSACACIIDEGEVAMEVNEILDSNDLAEGYRLACQSRPTTEKVKIRYS